MRVETYECQETAAEPIEATEEAIALMDELGLEGQQKLVSVDENKQPRRCPYSEATEEQMFIMNYVVPKIVKIESYNSGPIPLRVLQVVSRAKSIGMEDIVVRCKNTQQVDDPIVTGTMHLDPDSAWMTTTFLLARWGEELTSWTKLGQIALAGYKVQFKQKLAKIKQVIIVDEAALAHVDLPSASKAGMPAYYAKFDD